MLLLGVHHPDEPRHDQVDEADAASEILWVEQLDLDGVDVRAPLLLPSLWGVNQPDVPLNELFDKTHLQSIDLSLRCCLSRSL